MRPHQDVAGPQAVGRLLKQKAEQPVGEHQWRVQVERIAQSFRRIGNDDPVGSGAAGDRNRNVRY
jgi:hypothetical protein